MPDPGKSTTTSADAAPMAIFDHIAFGVPSIDAMPVFIAERLGGRPYARGPGLGFLWKQWQFAGGGVLEVLEPAGAHGGFLHRFLDRRGPGIHHVTFKVPDIRTAMERARVQGYDVVGFDDSLPGWKECFLHPKQAQGIVVQLAESNHSLDDGSEYVTSFGTSDVEPGPAVMVLGLHLTARSAHDARAQWGELLGGSLQRRTGRCISTGPTHRCASPSRPIASARKDRCASSSRAPTPSTSRPVPSPFSASSSAWFSTASRLAPSERPEPRAIPRRGDPPATRWKWTSRR